MQAQRDLDALGLFWDQGGKEGGPHAPYDQSQRFAFYRAQLAQLEAQGLCYPCFCSRAQLHAASAPHASDGELLYSGACRPLDPRPGGGEKPHPFPGAAAAGAGGTIAFTDLHYGPQQQYLPTGCGDFILRRSDGVYAYQLAVVADDGAMGVTQVVRAGTCSPPPPGRFCCTGCWATLCRNLATRPCCWPATAGGSPSGTGTSVSPAFSPGATPPGTWWGAWPTWGGLLPEPAPAWPEELLPLFSWEKLPREDIPLPAGLFGL